MCVSLLHCFQLVHFSPKWDFVSRADWLALSSGSKTHSGVLWTERERYCEWWSRLWRDSLVLYSASSHYTANTHTGYVAVLVPWIKPDFLFSQLGAGQFILHTTVWLSRLFCHGFTFVWLSTNLCYNIARG